MCIPEYSVRLEVHVWKIGDDHGHDWAKDVRMCIPPVEGMVMTLNFPGDEDEPWFTEVERVQWDEKYNRVTAFLKEERIGEGEDDLFLQSFEADPSWYDPYSTQE
jgi:hypothetical protein